MLALGRVQASCRALAPVDRVPVRSPVRESARGHCPANREPDLEDLELGPVSGLVRERAVLAQASDDLARAPRAAPLTVHSGRLATTLAGLRSVRVSARLIAASSVRTGGADTRVCATADGVCGGVLGASGGVRPRGSP